jgi:hypothetical protein
MAIYNIPAADTPLSQGDFFINVPYWRPHRKTLADPWPNVTQRGNLVLDLQSNSFAVLATQTCDIPRTKEFLFVAAYPATERADALETSGEHPMSEDEFRNWVVKNLHPRFHFFEQFVAEGRIIIPELVVNFRRPFTVRSEYVREKLLPDGHRVLCLSEIYSAEFGNRFGQYFARVATDRNMEST